MSSVQRPVADFNQLLVSAASRGCAPRRLWGRDALRRSTASPPPHLNSKTIREINYQYLVDTQSNAGTESESGSSRAGLKAATVATLGAARRHGRFGAGTASAVRGFS